MSGTTGVMVDRMWRLVATALCFATFGVGGVFIGTVVYPILRFTSPDAATGAYRAQALIHYKFQFFVLIMQNLGVITLEVRGAERLGRGGQLILPNHPSLIDVVILISLLRQTNCIVKEALWQNPFIRGPVVGAGYIKNCAGPELIEASVRALERGENLIVFPEGTRSVPNEPFRLQRGAATIAVRAKCIVTPVIITVSTPFLTKGEKWYRVPPVRPHITVEVKDDIDMEAFRTPKINASKAARQLTRWLQSYFTTEVGHIAAA